METTEAKEIFKEVLSENNYNDIKLSETKPAIIFEDKDVLANIIFKCTSRNPYSYYISIRICELIEDMSFNIHSKENFGRYYFYFDSEIQRSKFLHMIGYPEAEKRAEKKAIKAAEAKKRKELLKKGKLTIRKFKTEINKIIAEEGLFTHYIKESADPKCYRVICINKVYQSSDSTYFGITIPDKEDKIYKAEDFIDYDDYEKAYSYIYRMIGWRLVD